LLISAIKARTAIAKNVFINRRDFFDASDYFFMKGKIYAGIAPKAK
jgi:hypothetical protein